MDRMMEKEKIFHILEIPETRDEHVIKMAYMEILKKTNPEDDPEGFKRLRQAYEEALRFARQEEVLEAEPEGVVEQWIGRVDALYQDIMLRADIERWDQMFSDPVCEELDTSLEAREKLMAYLMNHIRLPHEVWQLIDRQFGILEDMEALQQLFPQDFLNYVSYYTEHETFIPYEFFEYRDPKPDKVNGDGYIEEYLSVKRQLDNGETKGCMQALDELKAFGLYHPYEDVERIRVMYHTEGEAQKSILLADRLLAQYPKDGYIRFYVGEAKWEAKDQEGAYEIWNKILEENPNHYSAKLGIARYMMAKKEYYEARELMLELLDNGRNEEVEADIRVANEALIEEFKKTLAEGRTDPRLSREEMLIKLGWCLFQNEQLEEAVELLADFTPSPEMEYLFCNLYGRLLYQMSRHEEALPYLTRWLELVRGLTDDGTKETRKRMSRHGGACYILSGCYYALGKVEEAEEMLQEAITAAEDIRDLLEYMQYLANIMMWSKQYEKSIDICDQIIKEDSRYYPAYLTRQESCYHLRKAQQVIDDYYKAIEIYAGYYKPYLLAAKVFFYYEQYKDAKGVIERAKENEVAFSSELKLFQVKILRNLANSRSERDVPRGILEEIAGELSDEKCDIEDKSEVNYEMGLLWWDDNEFDQSLEYLAKAIEQNPKRLQYRLIRGDVYLEMKQYQEAFLEYQAAELDYGDKPGIHYSKGLCCEGLNKQDEAMEHYKKALKFQNGYRDANEKLSDYYKERYEEMGRREDYEKAIYYINRQLEIKENCYYLVCRGLIYDAAMEQKLAIKDYQKALEYSPEKWIVWNNMGCSYKFMKQYEKAIQCCEKALEVMGEKKERMPYRNLADCYIALGDLEKAIEYYKKGLEITPDYEYFWEKIGDLYYYLDRFDEALEAYEHAKGRDHHYKDIGDVWLKRGDKEKCIWYYKEGIRKAEGKNLKAIRLSRLGDLYMEELFEFEKAVECLKEAIALTEDPYELYDYERHLARAYLMMGGLNEAKVHAQLSLDCFHKSGRREKEHLAFKAYAPARMASFGWLYLCLGEPEKAKEFFSRMKQIRQCKNCQYGGCFESFLYLGYLYQHQGKKKKALVMFEKALTLNPYCNEADRIIRRMKHDNRN